VKKLEDYMNDPSVINEPMPLREVYAIRLMIYDKIKDMTPKEINEYYMKEFEKAQKEYGFKVNAGKESMAYETKVILIAVLNTIRKAKDLREAYEEIAKMANAEGVLAEKWDNETGNYP
jgi:hypothetical protein